MKGTPMEGPLPLELQQIRADTQREEAALEAAKAALAAQRRKSEDTAAPRHEGESRSSGGKGGLIGIKLRRSSTGDTIQVVTDDMVTRRSSRPVKRRKFDDELEAGPGLAAGLLMSPLLTPSA